MLIDFVSKVIVHAYRQTIAYQTRQRRSM